MRVTTWGIRNIKVDGGGIGHWHSSISLYLVPYVTYHMLFLSSSHLFSLLLLCHFYLPVRCSITGLIASTYHVVCSSCLTCHCKVLEAKETEHNSLQARIARRNQYDMLRSNNIDCPHAVAYKLRLSGGSAENAADTLWGNVTTNRL